MREPSPQQRVDNLDARQQLALQILQSTGNCSLSELQSQQYEEQPRQQAKPPSAPAGWLANVKPSRRRKV
jgi:hypothetical protein